MKISTWIATGLVLALAAPTTVSADDGCTSKTAALAHHEMAAHHDVVDMAIAAGSFDTLVAAVQAAGLVETLKGEGPFTVFAPTDEAFAKIPKADLDALLADEEQLRAVLTYHVVPGKVLAADVVALETARTVQGQSITIDTSDGVRVDAARVVQTDIEASNGVIHVIDTVILPKG
ncbi:MAG: fasciclin domain-containing protein [Myxococcales bacterium]|nr:fasciclin domain-containing protein [Myxococcales bacterium]